MVTSPKPGDFAQPDSLSHDRWWFYLWAGWGLVCALLVGLLDQSLASGLFWQSVGLLIGRFGWTAIEKLISLINRLRSRLFPASVFPFSESSADSFSDSDSPSYLAFMTEGTINIIDPRRIPWDAYPVVVCIPGVMFGVLFGGVLGALFPVCYEWQMTAFDGALYGVVIGTLFLCVFFAILIPIIFYLHCLGPSVAAIRPVMQAAAKEAERQGAAYLVPGHVLWELLKNPADSVKPLLSEYPFDREEMKQFLWQEIHQDMLAENILEESPEVWTMLGSAIQAAKDQKHARVESGHLLLGLIEAWPKVTLQSLEMLGLQPEGAREEILAHLEAYLGSEEPLL